MPGSYRKAFLGCCKIYAFFFFFLYVGACYCQVPVGAPKWSVKIQLRAVHSAENSEMPFSKNRTDKLAV